MSAFGAVPSGSALPQYARALVRMHDAVISGGRPMMQPRALVSRSWSRVLGLGLLPESRTPADPVGPEDLERLRRQSALHLVIDELTPMVSAVADASHFLLVVTNADGMILWREGAAGVCRRADALGFAEGAEWTEARVGTNAIGTALAEAAPVQLLSGEHFEQAQHPWYCTAFPIHDPRDGSLLGVIDISGPALTLHPAIGALVEASVRLAQSQLWRRHEERLEHLRAEAAPVLAGTGGPALVVDDDGWVAAARGVHTRDRIGAPRPGRPVAMPGWGLCLPEQLAEGWLVRPAGSGAPQPITAHLIAGDPVVLAVTSGDGAWRVPLSARHAQIVRELHRAGPAGASARRLSCALFGDDEHLVTVRAEVSRLRRTLGAIVSGRPYRIAAGVALTVE